MKHKALTYSKTHVIPSMKHISRILPLVAIAGTTHAAILRSYDFEGFTPGTNGSTGTHVTTAYNTFSFGSGIESPRVQYQNDNPSDSPGPNYWLGWDGNMMRSRNGPQGADNSTLAAAVGNNAYFAFTYAPSSTVSLSSISLEAAVRSDLSAVAMPAGITLRSSLTGATNLAATSFVDARVEFAEHDDLNFDISGFSQFQDLASPVTFYFYITSESAVPTTVRREFFVDNLVLQGVPEPTSAGLLALGGMTLVIRRRRHHA